MITTATAILLGRASTRLNVKLFTKDFIFGNRETCQRLRNQKVLRPPEPPATVLRIILREAMSPTKRAEVFDDCFDLGSRKPIPETQCSLTFLAGKVRAERKVTDHPDTRGKEFEQLGKSIRSLLGYRFSDYEPKQTTVRIAYLLDRLSRDPAKDPQGRKGRILSLLRIPKQESASFELRTEYPTVFSVGTCATVSELREYVGLEFDPRTLNIFDKFYESLPDWANTAFLRLLTANRDIEDVGERASNLLRITQRISDCTLEDGGYRAPRRRLDADLYIHTHRWESLNFCRAYVQALKFAGSTVEILDIFPILDQAATSLFGDRPKVHAGTAAVEIQSLNDFLSKHRSLVSSIAEQAIGPLPRKIRHERVSKSSVELLRRVLSFSRGTPKVDRLKVSLAQILAAYIAVAEEYRSPTVFKVRGYGASVVSRSLSSTLHSPALNQDGSPGEVPEGLLQTWHLRYEWCLAGIVGSSERNRAKNELRRAIFEKISQCVDTLDFTAANLRFKSLSSVVDECVAASLKI
jgi:hypothetical protein